MLKRAAHSDQMTRRSASGSHKARFLAMAVALATLGALGAPRTATAQIPPVLRETNKAFFAAFEMGPAIALSSSGTQFKLSQSLGYHLFGGSEGPALGGAIQEAFGSGVFVFQIGPRFWWDFQPVAGLGLYLAPVAQIGYLVATGGNASAHFFNLQFGFEGRLALGNAGFVSFRPFTIDIGFGDVVRARYDMMFGGGVLF